MTAPGLEEKVEFLSRAEAYGGATRGVETIETHMSCVFLTDRHAYKLKKPVRYDSLDFSSPELRRHDCGEEVRLNRRLARDVYLGVVTLAWDPAVGLALEGPGEPVDWLVHMRRLPSSRMLDELIRRGAVGPQDVRGARVELREQERGAEPSETTSFDYRRRLEKGIHDDRRELCRPEFGLSPAQVTDVASRQLEFLRTRAELFDGRVREGRIVEGHGDLRPEHVFLLPEPVVIDCLEFSRELRLVDPLDELAFLALEVERLGNAAVGRWFLDVYVEVTQDEPPEALLDFYRTYRAMRRATLAVWHLTDPRVRERERWRDRAQWYLDHVSRAAV